PLPVTINDPDPNSPVRNCDNTSLSFASAQPELVADSTAVTWGGSWPNCTAVIAPVANANGTALITLKSFDGSVWGDGTSFTLTVEAENDSPTITPITAVSTNEDSPTSVIAISISDVDANSPARSCNGTFLSYSSGDSTIVSASGAVTWGGSWPNCTAVITPAPNAYGDAVITFTAFDGMAWSAGSSFTLTVTADNDAPFIAPIAAQTTDEDTPSIAFPVNVSDEDGPATAKSCNSNFLFYTSGNPLLVDPSGAVAWSGTWPNCSAIVTPRADAHGSTTLTFSASDGEDTGLGSSFVFDVNPVNDAPTISAISETTTTEDTPSAVIAVTIHDLDLDSPLRTCNNNFLFYNSDNTNLIAATGAVTWGGTWPNCTASVNPRADANGSATITFSAFDGGATGSGQSFKLNVTSVNDAPAIAAIPDQTTPEDTVTSPIAVTLTDVDGPSRSCNSASLSYTSSNTLVVAASGAVTWSGTWPNCTAVFTPVRDGFGTTTLALQATDGTTAGAPRSFSLNVAAVPDWKEIANIRRNNMIAHFGSALALSGNTVAVGAYGDSVLQSIITNGATDDTNTYSTLSNSGAVFVYRQSGSNWLQEAFIKASNSESDDQLGWSVSLSGDTMAVGANFEDSNQTTITTGAATASNNDAQSSGAVYVFGRVGTTWASEAYLKAANAEEGDQFGSSVSLHGSVLAVGAIGEQSAVNSITNGTTASNDNSRTLAGAVYVYRKTAGQWNQEAYVKAANASDDMQMQYGFSVTLNADTLAVGAAQEDSGLSTITNSDSLPTSATDAASSGAVYVYRRNSTGWSQEAYIKAVNAGIGDEFGTSVALSGELLAVGAKSEDSQQTVISNGTTADSSNTKGSSGAVYIYRRSGAQWAQEAFIKASNADTEDRFGSAVSLSGNTLAVGAPNEASNQTTVTSGTSASDNNEAAGRGAVYIYRRLGTSWSQEAYVKASGTACGEKFGVSVSLSGDTMAAGADGCAGTTGGYFALFQNASRTYDPDVRITGKTSGSISFAWGNNLGSSSSVKVGLAASGSSLSAAFCEGGTILNSSVTSYTYTGLTAGSKFGLRFCTTDGSNSSQGTTLWEETLP
ncbi:MAG: hypothetical protein RIR26_201, partial [Pseudomonadota bacterium]